MKDSPVTDYLGQPIHRGDVIAYATAKRIWTGRVTEIREYESDNGKWYKIQIKASLPKRHMTFDNEPQKMFLIHKGDR